LQAEGQDEEDATERRGFQHTYHTSYGHATRPAVQPEHSRRPYRCGSIRLYASRATFR